MAIRNAPPFSEEQLARYFALLERVRPEFSECEACLICEVLGGTAFEANENVVPQLHIAFSQAPSTHYNKWDVEKQSFVERVRSFSQAEGLAVVDAVEQFSAEQAHHAALLGTGLCDFP